MLYFLTKAYTGQTIWFFIWGAGWRRVPFIQPLTYEELFRKRRAPVGNYVFTDFDRMSAYEIQCAASVAQTMQDFDPAIRIYNHPLKALERFALLSKLQQEGLNDFGAVRLEGGGRPAAYPVFLRCEDDCKKPDSGLLQNETEFDAAVAGLGGRGIPLKRRIAVQYHAEASPDGFFRKYGALRIGNRIVLQHILRNTDWYVKRGQVERDAAAEQEFMNLFDNFTHAETLEKVFDLAKIDYGRADYGIVNGRIQIYEINTNPTIPKLRRKRVNNDGRYLRLAPTLLEGFQSMNTPHRTGPPIRFPLPSPQFEPFHPLGFWTKAELLRLRLRAYDSVLRPPAIPGFGSTR
ncbi:MAG: hypothetical protein ABL866_12310 [Devosia sp.]